MADMPKSVFITEEGPREGFQMEKAIIPTERKIEFIDALSETGIPHIQTVSFVNARLIPGMADAEAVVAGIIRKPGVLYTGLWLNEKGFDRAIATGRLDIIGAITLSASEQFLLRNQRRTFADQTAAQHVSLNEFQARNMTVDRGFIISAFGCNFEGDIPLERVLDQVEEIFDIAEEHGQTLKILGLADTMAWATPLSVKQMVGAIRNRHPDIEIALHLHNTRGQGLSAAYAGLEMGVARFDASVGGLGGCPFAGHGGASGNVCTEDFVFMCEEMGIETGIDLDALIECALLAEKIVGRELPGSVMRGGSLSSQRKKIAARAASEAMVSA